MTKFTAKRANFYWMEKIDTQLIRLLLPVLEKTFLTPNMVTACNLLLIIPAACYATLSKNYILLAALIQVYLLGDILDGNLARYKKLCSPMGKKLDRISDTLFYAGFYSFLAYHIGLGIPLMIVYLAVFYLHGLTATFYIVPRIRKMAEFKRWGIKKFFFDRGILFGMDLSTEDVIMTVFMLTPYRKFAFYLTIALYFMDVIYRLYELKRNERRILTMR
jgi:phosphatidylglycerophosphate synthase